MPCYGLAQVFKKDQNEDRLLETEYRVQYSSLLMFACESKPAPGNREPPRYEPLLLCTGSLPRTNCLASSSRYQNHSTKDDRS